MDESSSVVQFGTPVGNFIVRPSVYGVITRDDGKFLVVQTSNGKFYLVGGGIEEGEDPIAALQRELIEEAGCIVGELVFVGRANKFFEKTEQGPMNKTGVFYSGKLVSQDDSLRTEIDHTPDWFSYEEVQDCRMGDFQKWAVQQTRK